LRLSNWSDSVPLSWPEDEGSLPQEEEELVHVCPDEELPGVLHEPGVGRPARRGCKHYCKYYTAFHSQNYQRIYCNPPLI
jgi:hypothetical protein